MDGIVRGCGLVQGVRHAHKRTALNLPFDQRRIDLPANLVSALDAQDVDLAGFGIHLDLGDGAGVRFGRIGVHLAGFGIDIAFGLHVHAATGDGLAIFEVCGQRQVDDVDGACRDHPSHG